MSLKITPPTHTHHLSRKTVLPPKVRFRWWALKNLEPLWFASALLLSCLLPLWNGRETEKMWNSKVLPYPLLSRCFVVIWQVVPAPYPHHFFIFCILSEYHSMWSFFFKVVSLSTEISWKCADSELSVWKSTWHVSHGVCHPRNTCHVVLQLWKSLPCGSDSFGLTLLHVEHSPYLKGGVERVWAFPGGTISNKEMCMKFEICNFSHAH